MIYAIFIFNNKGNPRLTKFYTPIEESDQQRLLGEIYYSVSNRTAASCNFLESSLIAGKNRIIYRQYATLYFVFVVDEGESELGILDLIQVFVEALDRCFNNVCELDLVFKFQEIHAILAEIVSGGLVLETNLNEIVAASKSQMPKSKRSGGLNIGTTLSSFATRF
ncbi:AP-3 adaptor complex subunit Aps3 [Schizosaccharomyces osmophilus]|uniref:AP complex subunit sigma n=1 Tax=Schizosaccharomyces osmophilus TaxID=2545709 RepID=A0AAE9W8G4_9SCHI|nr:AP-3 adaptor complex subunit Aps3 [Schizosaccharomyces osmophilus]WBW71722.1 AP-3 adaptor complex subunit Aps3 [Schizosaccharomyces osmophilus]